VRKTSAVDIAQAGKLQLGIAPAHIAAQPHPSVGLDQREKVKAR
jgi:hypothetical protein